MAGDEEREVDDDDFNVADLAHDVTEALLAADTERAANLVKDLRAPDLADIIEVLSPEHRIELIQALGPAFDYEVLTEIDEIGPRPAL